MERSDISRLPGNQLSSIRWVMWAFPELGYHITHWQNAIYHFVLLFQTVEVAALSHDGHSGAVHCVSKGLVSGFWVRLKVRSCCAVFLANFFKWEISLKWAQQRFCGAFLCSCWPLELSREWLKNQPRERNQKPIIFRTRWVFESVMSDRLRQSSARKILFGFSVKENSIDFFIFIVTHSVPCGV